MAGEWWKSAFPKATWTAIETNENQIWHRQAASLRDRWVHCEAAAEFISHTQKRSPLLQCPLLPHGWFVSHRPVNSSQHTLCETVSP